MSTASDPYFAAANWTQTTNGGDGSGSITTDAMTLISNNAGGTEIWVRYSIEIPTNIQTLSFNYQWSTVDGWLYDTPSYFVGSTQTNICTDTDRFCSGTVTNLDLSTQVGQQFIFQQISLDGLFGRATLVISEVNGVITAPEPESAPVPAPAEVSVRKSSNLQFHEALYGTDKLSDPDGQLRKTVDAIDAKYGYLIK